MDPLRLPPRHGTTMSRRLGAGPGGLPIKKIAVAMVILLLFLWGLWFFAVPESLLVAYLQSSLAGRGIALELTGLKKGLFCSLHIEHTSLRKRTTCANQPLASLPGEGCGEGPLFVVAQNLDITPDMTSFLKMSPRFNIIGQIGRGRIHGAVGAEHGVLTVMVHGEHIDIGSLPILEQWGVDGEGDLAFDFLWKESRGKIVFSIEEANLRGFLAGNSAVPLNIFKAVKGLLTLENTIKVNSLALEGPGVYVSVKGEIRGGKLDGRAEVMMDASFSRYPQLQPLLERYRVSPGNYVISFPRV